MHEGTTSSRRDTNSLFPKALLQMFFTSQFSTKTRCRWGQLFICPRLTHISLSTLHHSSSSLSILLFLLRTWRSGTWSSRSESESSPIARLNWVGWKEARERVSKQYYFKCKAYVHFPSKNTIPYNWWSLGDKFHFFPKILFVEETLNFRDIVIDKYLWYFRGYT